MDKKGTSLEFIRLKNSDLTVSRFCMGGCPMGKYGWGEVHEEDLLDAVHTALELGINFFDTADTYGLGESEKTLSRGLGNNRQKVIIQTKFGVRVQKGKETVIDNTPSYIQMALEDSLRRLNTDYIDIYVVHYWDQKTHPAEIVEELEKHKKAGKIRYYGLSNVRPDVLALCRPFKGKFVTCQHEFSLCCRKWEAEVRQTVETMDVTPLTWGSLGQGMLSGKYDENSHFAENDRRRREVYINFHGEKLKHNLQIVNELRQVAAHHEKSCSATAVRFILDLFPEGVPIVGIKSAKQLRDIASSQDWHLTWEEMKKLNRISHADHSVIPNEMPWLKEI